MEREKRKNYERSFKEEAVKLVLDRGRPRRLVADELGINSSMLGHWIREHKQGNSFSGKGRLKPQDEEVRQLRRELSDVKMERDILKKAVGIFSRGPR